jgi:hypothetical protein
MVDVVFDGRSYVARKSGAPGISFGDTEDIARFRAGSVPVTHPVKLVSERVPAKGKHKPRSRKRKKAPRVPSALTMALLQDIGGTRSAHPTANYRATGL